MKTLKEKFIDDLKDGSKIIVTFKMYDSNKIVTATFIKVKSIFYRIGGSIDVLSFIDIKDIGYDLKIFDMNYKEINITQIGEPTSYRVLYENEIIPKFTKKEIENILGYEIEIVEEAD